ncbi:hypothetical protein NH340_JMT03496 [Sarcoptes scabiei]|nr:hypothetical protein NH340_JMT03496 [Sarcoptes scabiei]
MWNTFKISSLSDSKNQIESKRIKTAKKLKQKSTDTILKVEKISNKKTSTNGIVKKTKSIKNPKKVAKKNVELKKSNKKDEIEDDGKKIDEISSTVKCSDGKNQERQKRTLFIGNLPANFPMKKLKQTLQQYGKVISIRIRCIAPAKITLSKKTALLSNQINPNKKNVNAYVVFKDEDSVAKALELNGQKFENNIIQVDTIENDRTYDHSKSLFLGNLSFKANEEELREFFNDCGPIQSIRIVRDSQTGIGKGFGYVNFKSNDSLVLALEKNGNLFKNREIRIKAYNYQKDSDKNIAAKKETTKMKKKTIKKVAKSSNEIPGGDFQGEKSSKKLTKKKKSLKVKNRIDRIAKKKQKIAKILDI